MRKSNMCRSQTEKINVYGSDHYNQDVFYEVEPTLGSNCGISTGRNGVVIISKGENLNEKEQ